MDINILRERLDKIDSQLTELFLLRMSVCSEIGKYKAQNHIEVEDPKREKEILEAKKAQFGPEIAPYIEDFYEELFALSKDLQRGIADGEVPPEF